jgi:uncharacterized membrane protein YvbJ
MSEITNGWFCKKCDKVTEHRRLNNQETCLQCGSKLGYPKSIINRSQKKYRFKNSRHINISHWSPEQVAEFSKSILQQFKEQGE